MNITDIQKTELELNKHDDLDYEALEQLEDLGLIRNTGDQFFSYRKDGDYNECYIYSNNAENIQNAILLAIYDIDDEEIRSEVFGILEAKQLDILDNITQTRQSYNEL